MTKKLIVVISIMTLFMLGGCQSGPKTTADTLQKDVESMMEKGKQKAENIGNSIEGDVKDAVKYIGIHAEDPFSDMKVTKKMGYYGAYLKQLGSQNDDSKNHEIGMLGENVYQHILNVSSGIEEETSEISRGLKQDISTRLGKINMTKDTMIHDFSEMLNKR